MDPYKPYSPPAGLPQESKLVTYMNRNASSTPQRPALTHAMGSLSLEESPNANKPPQVREFIPMNYYAQATPLILESPGGSPPSVLAHMGNHHQSSHMGSMQQAGHMGSNMSQSHMGGNMQQNHMGGNMQQSHMGGNMQQSGHMGGNMQQSSHMGSNMQQTGHMGGNMQQTGHMGGNMQQSGHMSGNRQPSGHMGGNMRQSSHVGGKMLQSGHMGGNIQQNHMTGNIQQASHMVQPPQMLHENVGGTTYFYSSDSLNASALNSSASLNASADACLANPMPSPYASQMFIPMSAHMHPMPSKPGLAASFYQPETIRAEIYERNEQIFLPQELRQYPVPELPEVLDIYAELIPLEGVAPHHMTSSYRVTHRHTGEYFAMRRLHSYGTMPSKRVEIWKQIDHPNVVTMHDSFVTNLFGDHSMCLIYSYHPGCVNLMNKFLVGCGNPVSDGTAPFHDPFSSDPDAPRPYTHQKNAMLRAAASGSLLPEAVLWSVIVQLTAALRAIHNAGLACRTLDPSKVVMNGCRVRVAWSGAADALHPKAGDIIQAQQEDLISLGRLCLSLACRTPNCDNMTASVDLVTRSYSPDLKNLILFLLSGSPTRRSVTDLMPMIGARFYTQVEALQRRSDAFEDLLAVEIDNGRLFRLMVKLATCNERPELNCDTAWAETGHRYLLKLFRDYIFHAVSPDGRPWIDQAHVVNCLNSLDGGAPDRVPLMTRDEQSILVVSYAELKHCLEASFDEVMQASVGQQ